MRKKYTLLFTFVTAFLITRAQVPEDALRMSWNAGAGSARTQAVGGAINALGGDISSLFVNPAGIGLFKTGELIFTPGFSFYNGKGDYLETQSKTNQKLNRFGMGTSGVVWGFNTPRSKWNSKAFSIGVNRTADFNTNILYKGENNYSSFSEGPTNEFYNYYVRQKTINPNISDGSIIDNALNDTEVSLITKMSLYTYLIDIDSSGGTKNIVSRAEEAGNLLQENQITTRGGITEIAIGYAANMDDKLYLGMSLGIPIVNYERESRYSETDATGNTANQFNSFSYAENYQSKGSGINAKLGLIFKPKPFLRFGLGIHTPTLYALSDQFSSTMQTDVENVFPPGQNTETVNANTFYDGEDPRFTYDLVTPAKFIISGAYVFREIKDVTKQKGFLSADVEYINHTWNKFAPGDEFTDNNYYDDLNQVVDDIYKGAFNFRVGGELKFNTLMTRLGFAYYGNPYQDEELKGRRMNISGGLGYRNKGMFIDLTYVHQLNKDVNFAYRLEAPRTSNYADIRQNNGNILLTLGYKF